MKNRGLVATIVIMSGVIITLLVVLLVIKMPTMLGILDLKDKLLEKQTETVETQVIAQSTEQAKDSNNIEVSITTYNGYNDYVNVEYPVITGMVNKDIEEKINFKLRMNALSIVPLYPVSVATQKLNVFCEVKSLDSKYLTVVYKGTITGKANVVAETQAETTKRSSSKKTSESTQVVVDDDPYLNGFVDPLANGYVPQTTVASQTSNDASGLPLPVSSGVTVVGSPTNNFNQNLGSATIVETTSQYDNYLGGKSSTNTVDGGPTTKEVTSPTAASSKVAYGNTATNTPNANTSGNPGSSVGVGFAPIYSSSSSKTSSSAEQKIFFTNTIDLEKAKDVTLKDFGLSLNLLASYAKSGDVVFDNVNAEDIDAVKKYIKKLSEATLAEELADADFKNKDLTEWPKHFSYQDDDGNVCFSINVTNKLGGYVIIKYIK